MPDVSLRDVGEGMWSLGLQGREGIRLAEGTGVHRAFLAEERMRMQACRVVGEGCKVTGVGDLNAQRAVSVLHAGRLMGITWAMFKNYLGPPQTSKSISGGGSGCQ